jgi:SprT protein
MTKDIREELRPYLPENSLEIVMLWLNGHALILRLSRGRRSKLGDYRPPHKDRFHRISVNRDLHAFEFLITLAHEYAHLLTWERHGRRAKPHGKFWKAEYAGLLTSLIGMGIFPGHIEKLLLQQIEKPKANSKGQSDLVRALHEYRPDPHSIFLEDLPQDALFHLQDGRRFRKMEKLRTWYRCQNIDTRKIYRISPVTRVIPVREAEKC